MKSVKWNKVESGIYFCLKLLAVSTAFLEFLKIFFTIKNDQAVNSVSFLSFSFIYTPRGSRAAAKTTSQPPSVNYVVARGHMRDVNELLKPNGAANSI